MLPRSTSDSSTPAHRRRRRSPVPDDDVLSQLRDRGTQIEQAAHWQAHVDAQTAARIVVAG